MYLFMWLNFFVFVFVWLRNYLFFLCRFLGALIICRVILIVSRHFNAQMQSNIWYRFSSFVMDLWFIKYIVRCAVFLLKTCNQAWLLRKEIPLSSFSGRHFPFYMVKHSESIVLKIKLWPMFYICWSWSTTYSLRFKLLDVLAFLAMYIDMVYMYI
jgi:hypothetical protein